MKKYTSLDELRSDKLKAKRQMESSMSILKAEMTEYFVPTKSAFLGSSNKYLKYVGYAITAYRTVKTFRGAFKFLAKLL